MRRIAGLAVRFTAASTVKFTLLSVLVAIGMTVFLIVTELSRVSSEDLDEAIAEDVGETGTYRIDVAAGLGLSPERLGGIVGDALESFAARPPDMIEVMPPITPECPPYEELGPQPILIRRDLDGRPLDMPFGEALPLDSAFCFDGQEIPAAAVYIPTLSEQSKWGLGVFVDAAYARVAALGTTGPITHSFSVVTGQRTDQRDEIENAVVDMLHEAALRHGVDPGDGVFVLRVVSADSIRSASEGIKLVYGVIGWGVLLLGGLGLLVSELIVVRDRRWFFGLARAVGARAGHIAALILTDIALVLLAGTALALVIALAAQPMASAFAQDAFQVDIELLLPSSIPRLMVGALLVLVVAGVYPAIVAIRQDPLDVLEPRDS